MSTINRRKNMSMNMTKAEVVEQLEALLEKVKKADEAREFYIEVDDNFGGSYFCQFSEWDVLDDGSSVIITNA